MELETEEAFFQRLSHIGVRNYVLVTNESKQNGTQGGIATHAVNFSGRVAGRFEFQLISCESWQFPSGITRRVSLLRLLSTLVSNAIHVITCLRVMKKGFAIEVPEFSGHFFLVAWFARLFGAELVARVHGGSFFNRLTGNYEKPSGINRLIARLELGTISKAQSRLYVSNFMFNAYARFVGLDGQSYLSRPSLSASFIDHPLLTTTPTRKQITFFGTCSKEKGFLDYLDAAATVSRSYPDRVRFVAAGRATRGAQKRMSELKSVTYLGPQTPRDLVKIIDDSAFVVLPYYNEPFGLATLEAMARGKIVIGLDEGGTAEIIENEVDGILLSRVALMSGLLSREIIRVHKAVLKDEPWVRDMAVRARQKAQKFMDHNHVL